MSYFYNCGVIFVLIIINVKVHEVACDYENRLQLVSSLYVRPSMDGTTGDLYVVASEDSGVQSQWVVDQAVNILPAGASVQTQKTSPAAPCAHPLAASTPSLVEDVQTIQKHPLIVNPFQYALAAAMPMLGSNGDTDTGSPYTYAVLAASNASPEEVDASKPLISPEDLSTKIIQTQTHYMPLQILYPGVPNSKSNSSDNTHKEDTNVEVFTPPLSGWPYPHTYPAMQYLAMKPSIWSQNQPAVFSEEPPSQTDTPDISNEENVQNE